MTTNRFMAAAIALSRKALEMPGAAPYGAVVVRNGEIVGEGLNQARARHDPTSHGEVEAIRDACRRLGTLDLTGCELYASCEPCPLCVAAMTMTGISRLTYGAGIGDNAEVMQGLPQAMRPRVSALEVRREAGLAPDDRRMPAEQAGREDAIEVLHNWVARKASEA